MEPKTKTEAQQRIDVEESKAATCVRHALKARAMNIGSLMQRHALNAEVHRDEANRLRALLPFLPD